MYDLHVHSHWSDGEHAPQELVRMARQAGLSGLALADHDTMQGIPQLEAAGRTCGLPVFGSVEISCTQADGRPLHLLAYQLPEQGRPAVEDFCRPIRQGRNEAIARCTAQLAQAGYPVSLEAVRRYAGPSGDLCKQYIMQALMDAGCGDGLYGALYQRLFKRGPKGEPPVAPLAFPTADPAAAVRCIVRAGGKAVLAHPGQYDNFAALPALVQAGLWGIEAYHPKHRPGDIERCLKLAHAHGLGITGGSDFHGRFGEGEAMGECGVASLPFL